MPVPANATDIAKGVMLERVGSIDRSRRSVEGRVQPLGLAVPGWNAKTKGQQTLGQHTLGQHTLGKDAPAAVANGWIVVIMPHLHRSQFDGCH